MISGGHTADNPAATIMGYAMATNRWVPGPNPRAADEGWKLVLAMANEDAAVALSALREQGYSVCLIGRPDAPKVRDVL